jgi:hypothetical protein
VTLKTRLQFRRISLLLTLLFGFVFFKSDIDIFLRDTFAFGIFKHSVTNIITDIVLLLGYSFVLIGMVVSRISKCRLSFSHYAIGTALVGVYLVYRWAANDWVFIHFTFCESWFYLDILLLLALYPILGLFTGGSVSKKMTNLFVEDNPIDLGKIEKDKIAAMDLFSRYNYAKSLSDKLKFQVFQKAFSIGVLGEWGSGKTHFLRYLESELVDEDERIIIHFSPWDNHGGTLLLYEFFSELGDKFGGIDPKLADEFENYGKRLFDESKVGWINLLREGLNLFMPLRSTSIKFKYDEIQSALKEINKQVVVFVDDIDRLSSGEIIEFLKMVRNTANFFNTVFIVAFDKDYVIGTINSAKGDYIEKFFQLEISLPLSDQYIIREEFLKYLVGAFRENELKVINENVVNLRPGDLAYKDTIFDRIIKSLRDSKKFANLMILDLENARINGHLEVDTRDFFLVELLKFKFPNLFTLIYQKRGIFFHRFNNVFELVVGDNSNSKETRLDLYLTGGVDLKVFDRQLAKDIITQLFGESREVEPRNLSIRNARHFDSYFASLSSDGRIIESEFESIFTLEELKRNAKLEGWLATDPDGLYEKLSRRSYSTAAEFEIIISSMYLLAKGTENRIYRNRILNDFGNKIYFDALKEGGIYKAESELGEFVNKLFSQSKYPYLFESNILQRVLKDNLGKYGRKDTEDVPTHVWGLTVPQIKKLQTEYLRLYLEKNNELNDDVYQLFANSEVRFLDHVDLNQDSLEIMRILVAKDQRTFESFIENYALETQQAPEYQLDGGASFIYFEKAGIIIDPISYNKQKTEAIRKLASNYSGEKIDEFKTFLNAFEDNGYSYTKFAFLALTPRSKRR